jgi:hypothetical protein
MTARADAAAGAEALFPGPEIPDKPDFLGTPF